MDLGLPLQAEITRFFSRARLCLVRDATVCL